mgnify:CR=1 FL=1
MFKENKINLFIMVKFTIRKIQNPPSVYNKMNQLDLKRLNDRVKQMILKNDIKILSEAIKNGKEKIENNKTKLDKGCKFIDGYLREN